MKAPISIALHGGAGTILPAELTPEKDQYYKTALLRALQCGLDVLQQGGSALDAVCAAVCDLENEPVFNAGRGAVFTAAGTHEMDASVMDGQSGGAGAVCGISRVVNPVLLARAIMEKTPHVLITGDGAEKLAAEWGLPMADAKYFHTDLRYAQWQQAQKENVIVLDHTEFKTGTVGAVARDIHGNLAAATSTGGMTNKMQGRVGDSPIIGAGTWADNRTCAISCTGHGEIFMKQVVAYDIHCLMEYKGLSLADACRLVVNDKLVKAEGEGGLVALSADGNPVLAFNSPGMYRAWFDTEPHAAIF